MKKLLYLIIVLTILLFSCTYQTTYPNNNDPPHTPRPMPNTTPLVANEDGLYFLVRPRTLLGGMTEERWIEDALATPTFGDMMMSVALNPGGGVLIHYSSAMISTQLYNFYNGGLLHTRYYVDAIKEVVYENELLSGITIFVDVELFQSEQYWNEREAVFFFLPNWVGMFQLFSGVAHDEWHTTITIRCYDTNAFVSRTEFPHDNMFVRNW